jgi:hypothetical protein
MPTTRGLSPKAWNGNKSDFNLKYRERRRAAAAAGRPFPDYKTACEQLDLAVQIANESGEVGGINEFWDFVFRPPQDDRTPTARRLGRGPVLLDRDEHFWRAKAEEAKALAEHMTARMARETMERIAASYDYLAEHAKKRGDTP